MWPLMLGLVHKLVMFVVSTGGFPCSHILLATCVGGGGAHYIDDSLKIKEKLTVI
jgi:hypothetical protein